MDIYSRPALVKPHQDDLMREAAAERLAREGRDDSALPAYKVAVFWLVAHGATIVAKGADHVAVSANAHLHHGHAAA